MTTQLLVIRHGETDWNRAQRFQGQIDVPLNANGHAQAQRLAARLGAERPDVLYTSDLQRAVQTAAPLAAAWGMQPLALPSLREQHFGIFEGETRAALQVTQAALWRLWLVQQADFALPNGESQRQFHTRVLAAVRGLAEAHAGQRLAIVTHGGVLDMLWRTARAQPLDGLRTCAIPNTGVNRLRWVLADDGGALLIDQWADDAHLHGMAVLQT